MPDSEQIREGVIRLQRLRELTAQRIETEFADQARTLKLLEEKNRATIERLIASKYPQSAPLRDH
jgi:hypothetical protein